MGESLPCESVPPVIPTRVRESVPPVIPTRAASPNWCHPSFE
jgi:hypothetical protein